MEFRASSGGLVPTGEARTVLKNAAFSAAQLSYLIRRDLHSAGEPRLDAFMYDLSAEVRTPQLFRSSAVTLSPFVGLGVGARNDVVLITALRLTNH